MWILTHTAIFKSEILEYLISSHQYTQRRDVFPWVRKPQGYITLKSVVVSSDRRQYIGFLLWDFEATSPKITRAPDYRNWGAPDRFSTSIIKIKIRGRRLWSSGEPRDYWGLGVPDRLSTSMINIKIRDVVTCTAYWQLIFWRNLLPHSHVVTIHQTTQHYISEDSNLYTGCFKKCLIRTEQDWKYCHISANTNSPQSSRGILAKIPKLLWKLVEHKLKPPDTPTANLLLWINVT
jgi:hypothetical protein